MIGSVKVKMFYHRGVAHQKHIGFYIVTVRDHLKSHLHVMSWHVTSQMLAAQWWPLRYDTERHGNLFLPLLSDTVAPPYVIKINIIFNGKLASPFSKIVLQ